VVVAAGSGNEVVVMVVTMAAAREKRAFFRTMAHRPDVPQHGAARHREGFGRNTSTTKEEHVRA
jgi:hypothetical protein